MPDAVVQVLPLSIITEPEDPLVPKILSCVRSEFTEAVKTRIVGVKKSYPEYGPRCISDILKRIFLVSKSAISVYGTVSVESLTKNPKPKFFERSRPIQLWQGGVMTFGLGVQTTYLIGFFNDYSRYITSLGLYSSQTAKHVLEAYRR